MSSKQRRSSPDLDAPVLENAASTASGSATRMSDASSAAGSFDMGSWFDGGEVETLDNTLGPYLDGLTDELARGGVPADPGAAIDATYADEGPVLDATEEVDLSTPEGRLAAVNGLTQNTAGGAAMQQHMCGATSMMAGALLAGGADGDGMKAIIEMSMNGAGKTDAFLLGSLQKKLDAGKPLTRGDLELVKESLHGRMRREHQRQGFAGQGVDGKVVQDMLRGDEDLAKLYRDNGMSLSLIDHTGGDGSAPNHFVLRQDTEDGTRIYNPQAKENGQQVMDSPDDVALYDAAERFRFGPDNTTRR